MSRQVGGERMPGFKLGVAYVTSEGKIILGDVIQLVVCQAGGKCEGFFATGMIAEMPGC